MRLLYSAIFYLLLPFILLRLLWRGIKAPQYRQRWAERFGFFPVSMRSSSSVWFHSVSVGETIALKPVIDAWLKTYPDDTLIITTMTPTGSARVNSFFSSEIERGKVVHSYIPYDLPDCVNRFLSRTKPKLAVFMETEVWPNTLRVCKNKRIPTVLINARLSEKSLKGYRRFASLATTSFSSFSCVAAQTQEDADRINVFTDSPAVVTGNIKSEVSISKALKKEASVLKAEWSLKGKRKIIIAASTHRGEDEICLSAYQQLIKSHPSLLMVIVPRHPENFSYVKQLCKDQEFRVNCRSENTPILDNTQIVVGDTMGEMMLMCGAADIAIVCGSFIEHGGHNMLEPAAWGLPVLSGHSVYNFAKIADDMVSQNSLYLVGGESELVAQLDRLLADDQLSESMGRNAKAYVEKGKGALSKTMDVLNTAVNN